MVDAFDYVRARGDLDSDDDTGLDPFEYANAEGYDDSDDGDAGSLFGDARALLRAKTPQAQAAAMHKLKTTSYGGPLESIGSAVKSVGSAVGKVTNNPLWKMAQTGASFIPGVGTAVSAGMASAAAIGRGESIQNIGLAAARGALPPVAQAGLDVAVGALKGHKLDAIALRTIRNQVPGGAAGRGAFDAGIALATRASPSAQQAIRARLSPIERQAFDRAITAKPRRVPPALKPIAPRPGGRSIVHKVPLTTRPANLDRAFPSKNIGVNRTAAMFLRRPTELRSLTPAKIAQTYSVPTRDVRDAIASFLQRFGATRVHDARDVGDFESLDQCALRHGCAVPADLAEWPSSDAGAVEAVRLPPVAVTRGMLKSLYSRGDDTTKRAILAHELLAHVARNTGELEGTSWRIKSGDIPYKVAQSLTGDANRWREIPSVNPGMSVKTINGVTQLTGWNVGKVVQLPPGWFPSAVPAPAARPSTSGPPFPAPSEYPAGYPSSVYVIRAGDSGEKVAARITGQASRWRELLTVNPTLADPKYGIALYTGKALTLPSSWVKPQPSPVTIVQSDPAVETLPEVVVTPTPVVAVPTPGTGPGKPPEVPPFSTGGAAPGGGSPSKSTDPVRTTDPPSSSAPIVTGSAEQIATVQLMLAAFYRTHPETTYGYPGAPYGTQPEDLAGVWTPRTQTAFMGFEAWWNGRGRSPSLVVDGLPDGPAVAALIQVTSEDGGGFDVKTPIQLAVRGIPQTPAGGPGAAPKPPTPTPPAPPAKSSGGGGGGGEALLALGLPLLLAAL